MNSYQMVLHRPVETARLFSKFSWSAGSSDLNLLKTPYFGSFAPSASPKLSPLTLRLRVDLQITARKIVPKGRPMEVL